MSENANVGKVFNLTGGAGSATIPVASDTAPQMDGTASAGSSQAWSRADHVHPTDTSRAAASHTHSKTDITDFPSTMDPTAHTHTKSEITDFTHTHTKSEITDFPSTMPPSLHTHSAEDITSGTLGSARLPTVPLTKGGTGQTSAAKGLHALINGATAITAANVADTDYIGLDDVSATTGKKVLVSELKKLTAPMSGTATCPASSSWTLDSTSGLYYVTVSLTGVLATHKLHLTPTINTSDTATGEAQQEAWDTHYYAESVAGGVKFYATEAPTVAVTFTWEAVI